MTEIADQITADGTDDGSGEAPGPGRLTGRVTLRHAAILGDGAQFHLTRATLSNSRPRGLHDHDFHELIWVQNGTVRHHMTDHRADLTEGDMLFIRPHDLHALQGRGEEALVVSVVLHPGLVDSIGARHPALAGRLFWSDAPLPQRMHRDIRQMAELNHAALRLERAGRDALEAEAFLLPLCASLCETLRAADPVGTQAAGAVLTEAGKGAPDWLIAACAAASDPRVFREGAAGFARVAGRAHPHVSRTARRFLGQTPSDYINAQRMAYAARKLAGTTDTLAEIAADCGIPNLSHFHKLFRAQHGLTPQRYRRVHQRDVVQPGHA